MPKIAYSLWLVPFALSCASVHVVQANPGPPKPSSCKVDFYASEGEVRRPYTIACRIKSTTGTTAFHEKTFDRAIEQIYPEACKCGADALVLMSMTDDNELMLGTARRGVEAAAIRYVVPPPPEEELPLL